MDLGFISITRYRDIDHGVGDLAIIAAPRHRTISHMKASLTSALLNSSHRTHSAIIIARTVTGHHLKGPNRRPVGNRAPPRDRAVQHTITLHKAALFDLYFAPSIYPTPTLFMPDHDDEWTTAAAGAGGGSFVGGQHPMSSHFRDSVVSCQQRCADCKS